jgi:hypothetical protein
MSGVALQITLQRVDAAALLWRLHLLGVDVASRCAELLAAWDLSEGAAQQPWHVARGWPAVDARVAGLRAR